MFVASNSLYLCPKIVIKINSGVFTKRPKNPYKREVQEWNPKDEPVPAEDQCFLGFEKSKFSEKNSLFSSTGDFSCCGFNYFYFYYNNCLYIHCAYSFKTKTDFSNQNRFY